MYSLVNYLVLAGHGLCLHTGHLCQYERCPSTLNSRRRAALTECIAQTWERPQCVWMKKKKKKRARAICRTTGWELDETNKNEKQTKKNFGKGRRFMPETTGRIGEDGKGEARCWLVRRKLCCRGNQNSRSLSDTFVYMGDRFWFAMSAPYKISSIYRARWDCYVTGPHVTAWGPVRTYRSHAFRKHFVCTKERGRFLSLYHRTRVLSFLDKSEKLRKTLDDKIFHNPDVSEELRISRSR